MSKRTTGQEGKETKNITNNNKKWHCVNHKDVKDCMDECKVKFFLNLFGKKYAMPIVRHLLLNGRMRFNEIQDSLNGSPKTITSRLRELEKSGLVNREVFKEIPMRVEYSLTKRGEDLDEIFEKFAQWANAN